MTDQSEGAIAPAPSRRHTHPVVHNEPQEAFWEIAFEFLSRDGVEEGTMFGFACLRADGEFVAMPGRSFGGMMVKLPASRVAALIETSTGSPVAPAGRPFKEWVAVDDQTLWPGLIEESLAFVTRNTPEDE
jgi:hypothetical protein